MAHGTDALACCRQVGEMETEAEQRTAGGALTQHLRTRLEHELSVGAQFCLLSVAPSPQWTVARTGRLGRRSQSILPSSLFLHGRGRLSGLSVAWRLGRSRWADDIQLTGRACLVGYGL